jgi:hypothetical protein
MYLRTKEPLLWFTYRRKDALREARRLGVLPCSYTALHRSWTLAELAFGQSATAAARGLKSVAIRVGISKPPSRS